MDGHGKYGLGNATRHPHFQGAAQHVQGGARERGRRVLHSRRRRRIAASPRHRLRDRTRPQQPIAQGRERETDEEENGTELASVPGLRDNRREQAPLDAELRQRRRHQRERNPRQHAEGQTDADEHRHGQQHRRTLLAGVCGLLAARTTAECNPERAGEPRRRQSARERKRADSRCRSGLSRWGQSSQGVEQAAIDDELAGESRKAGHRCGRRGSAEEDRRRGRHALEQPAHPLEAPGVRAVQHCSGGAEQKRLERGMAEDVEQRPCETESRDAGRTGRQTDHPGPERHGDDADVLDAGIGERTLQIRRGQDVDRAENRARRAAGEERPAPGRRHAADDQQRTQQTVRAALQHHAREQGRDVARRHGVGRGEPGVERREAHLGPETREREHEQRRCHRRWEGGCSARNLERADRAPHQ